MSSNANLRVGLVCQWDSRDYVPGSPAWVDRLNGTKLNFQDEKYPTNVTADGVEIENNERYVSDNLLKLGTANDVTLEWYGRIDGVFDNDNPAACVYISDRHNWWGGVGMFAKEAPSGIMFDVSRNDHARIISGFTAPGFYHFITTMTRREAKIYLNSSSILGYGSNFNGYLDINKNYIYTDEGSGVFKGALQKINLWTRVLSDDEIISRMTDIEFKNSFYMKRGDTWALASGIYRKRNGSWELSDENEMLSSRKIWGKAFLPMYTRS